MLIGHPYLFLEEMFIQILCPLSIGSFVVYYSLHILGISSLFAKSFSHSVGYFFIFFIVSFDAHKL